MNIYDSYQLRIIDIINRNYPLFFQNPNIHSIGLGLKIINNKMTTLPTLSVFVKKKFSSSSISKSLIIPKLISGTITDVIEKSELDTPYRKPVRPTYGGAPIGTNLGNLGTLACAVTEKKIRKNIYALTCSHVCKLRLVGDYLESNTVNEIFQPNVEKIEDLNTHFLAEIEKSIPIYPDEFNKLKKKNEVDAALCIVDSNSIPGRKLLSAGLIDKTVINNVAIDVKPGDLVYKIGCTSGKTKGKVIATNLITGTNYCNILNQGNKVFPSLFHNQISCEIAGGPGDSGALGIREKDNAAFGMLMSGSKNSATFNDINKVLDLLDVELLQP